MNDLISRENVLDIFHTMLESGAFNGRYGTYEKITDAIRKDIPPYRAGEVWRLYIQKSL